MAGQERGTEGGRQLNEQSCVYQGIRFESLVLEFKIKKLCVCECFQFSVYTFT